MATGPVYTSNQLQSRVTSLLQELQQKDQQLQAVQRNYQTVSRLLHMRAQEVEVSQATQQLLAEESHQLKRKLEDYSSRVEAAERREAEYGSHLPDKNLQLQKEIEVLLRERDEECRQRLAIQDQLSRLKQELYAVANVKQSLTEQLQQQYDQVQSANATVVKLKQQLEDEVTESRDMSSQQHALRDALSRCAAQQQDMEQKLAAWRARAKNAEELAAAEQASATKLQQELNNAKGSQANNALRLMEIQNNHQQMELKLAMVADALSVEQAARAEAERQVESLKSQLASAQSQAEAAKANAAAAALAVSKACFAADEAQAARYAAEEAWKTAEAAAKVAAQRMSDAQHTAAQERAIAEAAQHELGNLLSSRDAAFQLQLQQQQGWKFRQLEFMTRSMHRLDALDTKFTALDGVCSSIIAAVGQQCQEQQDRLMYQLNKMVECQAGVCQLEATGDKINMLLACVQQQWAAKQQKLHASDKGMQVLQKQLDQLEQQVYMSTVLERKLRGELEDVKAGRKADQQQAKLEVEQAEAATAAAQIAAEAVQVASAQQVAAVAQLETKLATAEADMVSLRCQLATGDAHLRGVIGHVASANKRLQRLAGAASDMAGMLERAGALQPQDVSVVMSNLAVIGAVAAKPPTASRPNTTDPAAATTASRPSTPSDAVELAGSCSGRQSNRIEKEDTSGSRQLVEGLGSMQHQMQVLLQAMQQLSESYPKLLDSWQESERTVASTVAKLAHVETSLASNYTCLICMRVFDDPVAVIPCGHNYCKSCFISSGSSCRECCSSTSCTADMLVSGFVPAPALEHLCAKYDYRMMTLKALQSLLAQRHLHNIHGVDLVTS